MFKAAAVAQGEELVGEGATGAAEDGRVEVGLGGGVEAGGLAVAGGGGEHFGFEEAVEGLGHAWVHIRQLH